MRVPFLLLVVSLGGLAFAVQAGRMDYSLLLVACAVASLFLVARDLIGRLWRKPASKRPTRNWPTASPTEPRRPASNKTTPDGPAPKWIVIDGSNVLHWVDGTPQLFALVAVIDRLTALGFAPGVVLDANAGYKVGDRYQHHDGWATLLGLPEDRVLVVDKGTPADPTLLTAARDLGAQVVSNDRFRDWADTFPEVTSPGHVVRGGFRDGQLWLDLT